MSLQLAAIVAATLFTGAALYITLVEHLPAWISTMLHCSLSGSQATNGHFLYSLASRSSLGCQASWLGMSLGIGGGLLGAS